MNRRTMLKSAAATMALAAELQASDLHAADLHAAEVTSDTVYELRVYHMNEGKLPLILDRFRSKETAIFERLGMHGVAYWTPVDDPANAEPVNTLIYLLRHQSREAARQSWARFRADPEWIALKAETEKDGAFVVKAESTFLKLTDFSPRP